jgi:periplasmic mercuric ion binding protein
MKTKINLIILIILISSFPLLAQKAVKTTLKVYGNCLMCKKRIETALDRNGIKVAAWDATTKNLEVVYNRNKITEQQIHELIASAGHDTEKVKAKDEVYATLPYCCLYRDHDHSGIRDEHPHHE